MKHARKSKELNNVTLIIKHAQRKYFKIILLYSRLFENNVYYVNVFTYQRVYNTNYSM